jgi:hypothetical protein
MTKQSEFKGHILLQPCKSNAFASKIAQNMNHVCGHHFYKSGIQLSKKKLHHLGHK